MDKNINILSRYLLYLLFGFLICLVGISNVFGYTYTDIGYLSTDTDFYVQTDYYSGLLGIPKDNYYQLEHVSSIDVFIDNINWSPDSVYAIQLNLVGTTLNSNANIYSVIANGNETCTPQSGSWYDGNYPTFFFKCNNTIREIYLRIYNTSNSFILPDGQFRWNYTFARYRTASDTQDIINNQNQNTQDIINNQNQNTQDIIDSQKVCNEIDKRNILNKNTYLNNGVEFSTLSALGTTDFINIYNSELTLLKAYQNNITVLCFYNVNKTYISCLNQNDVSVNQTVTLPNNSYYAKFVIFETWNQPTWMLCRNGSQATTDAVNGLNDTLNDDDTDGATSEASDFFESFTTNTFGLTSIITSPLNLIQSLTSSSCSELYLPLPYLNNKYLDLPCMSSIYQTYFGAFFTMYQTITYGIIAYWVIVRIFNQVKDFKNPEHDEIEVVDL